MINPACIVAANLRINYIAVFQPEVESVWTVLVVWGSLPGDAFARVFDNAPAFGDELHGVNAATVHTRFANLDASPLFLAFIFLRHEYNYRRVTPRLRRLLFVDVRETCNSDRLLASSNIARTSVVLVKSAHF